jgi:DNA polymerase-4
MQNRQIIHVDMDAFYASVEQADHPELKGKPVIVGGSPEERGVVSAASYEARRFGIHSAMPAAQAHRLCPQGIFLPVRIRRYVEISRAIGRIFYSYTPQVEPVSIDEAFLDVSGCLGLFGSTEHIGRQIKAKIREEFGLTASVGIAPNKFLAKLASDIEKPDGFVVITEENKQQILDPLPVGRIWGIGKVTEKALNEIGIVTIEQLRKTPTEVLAEIFGNQASGILELAQGIDTRAVETEGTAKSISSEETFATDIEDKDTLLSVLLGQVEEVAQRLRAEKLQARTVTLKIRYGNFRTITRSATLEQPTQVTQHLWDQARLLFDQWHQKSAAPLRLLGFGVSGLSAEGTGQQLLFDNLAEQKKQKKLDTAFDTIRQKYGDDALKHGANQSPRKTSEKSKK